MEPPLPMMELTDDDKDKMMTRIGVTIAGKKKDTLIFLPLIPTMMGEILKF